MIIYKKLNNKVFIINSESISKIKGLKKALEKNLNSKFCRQGLIGNTHESRASELMISTSEIDYTIVHTTRKLPVKYETFKKNFNFNKDKIVASFDIEFKNDNEAWIFNVCKNTLKNVW